MGTVGIWGRGRESGAGVEFLGEEMDGGAGRKGGRESGSERVEKGMGREGEWGAHRLLSALSRDAWLGPGFRGRCRFLGWVRWVRRFRWGRGWCCGVLTAVGLIEGWWCGGGCGVLRVEDGGVAAGLFGRRGYVRFGVGDGGRVEVGELLVEGVRNGGWGW